MSGIYFNRSVGAYNWLKPEDKQANLMIGGLPPEAPANNLSVSVEIDGQYDYQDDDIWDALDSIEAAIESFWVSTARDSQRLAIKWLRENKATLNVEITKTRAIALQKAAAKAADKARSALYAYDEALDEVGL